MSPTSTFKRPSGFNKVQKTMTKRMKVLSDASERTWYDINDENVLEKGLKIVHAEKLRTSFLPKKAGVMRSFPVPIGLRMNDVKVIAGVDENKRLCILLTKEQYDFFSTIQSEIMSTLIPDMKVSHPRFADGEAVENVRVSEKTENPYMRTKVQLRGMSRTLGISVEGEDIMDHEEALSVPGTIINANVGITGAYLSGNACGLVTSISMYRVKSRPTEEEIKAEMAAMMKARDAERMEELRNF